MVQPIGFRVLLSPTSSRASSPDSEKKKKLHSPVSNRKDHKSARSTRSTIRTQPGTQFGRHVHASPSSNKKHHSD